MRRPLSLAAALVLGLPAAAGAHRADEPAPPPARMAQNGELAPCPGAPITADRVITGSFGTAQQGAYVLVPFDVPAGTTAVRVKYCFDQPESPLSAQLRHTLDLGVYGPGDEFRGWGGSSHPDVTVSAEGFSGEAEYLREPKGHVPGRTTRGFLPGPVRPGAWAAELGVAAVVPQAQGDADGQVAWRVEVELGRDPAFADEPYRPAPYDARPARTGAGWYAGDLHVHAEHSALGDATTRETLDYAFGDAGLDFITLSDYVTSSGWGEIGRHQDRYPGKLVARSAEVITYRGHTNNHSSATAHFVDYRTGPVYERRFDGSLALKRPARPASAIFTDVLGAGGVTQVNHPTIFPSEVPGFAGLCRGCPWDYSDADTRWELVDAYEVHTGPPGNDAGNNPFTTTAIDEYDRLRRAGHRLAAVGVSDSHNAGRAPNAVTQAPLGTGRTVVFAGELSERGVADALRAGRSYVKVFGPSSADLRLEATNANGSAIIGGALPGDTATLRARVLGGDGRTLLVLRDGRVIDQASVSGDDFAHELAVRGTGDYRLQVLRGAAVDALTTPIRLGTADPSPTAPAAAPPRARLRLSVRPRRVRAGRRVALRVRVTAAGQPVRSATVRVGGRRVRTGRTGRATLRYRFRSRGRRTVRATLRGHRSARVAVTVRRARPARPRARR